MVPRSRPADELDACLKWFVLWENVETLKLSTNMRVEWQNDHSGEVFSKQLLDIGNGEIPVDKWSRCIHSIPMFVSSP